MLNTSLILSIQLIHFAFAVNVEPINIYTYYISHPIVTIVQNNLFTLSIQLILIAFPVKFQPITLQLLKQQLLRMLLTWWQLNSLEILRINFIFLKLWLKIPLITLTLSYSAFITLCWDVKVDKIQP